MMKFFRKYTKHLLAIFMALLLIVWLGGDAITSLLLNQDRQQDFERGTLAGKKIRQSDVAPIFQELEILKSPDFQRDMFSRWQMIWLSVLPDLGVRDQSTLYQYWGGIMQTGRGPLDEDEWFLLVTEARNNGVFVPDETVEQFKAARGLTGPGLRQLRQQFSTQHINNAIRSYLMVQKQALAACRTPAPSEADIRKFIRDTAEKAEVTVVKLQANEASKFYDPNYNPSDEELAKLFEEYKETASQPAGMGFGYQMPEAAAVEYLRISPEPLRASQTITDDAAFEYWRKNKNQFTRLAASQPAPTTGPAQPPRMEPYPTFVEAKNDVIQHLQKEKANQAALRIAGEILDDLNRSKTPPTATGPAEVESRPADESSDQYAKAFQKWSQKYPGAISEPRTTALLDAMSLGADPQIGPTSVVVGESRGLPLNRLAFLVDGLAAAPDREADEFRYYRRVNETCPAPLADEAGNLFVFRTTAIRPKQAPPAIDMVKAQVVKDARVKHAYELAGQKAKALKERAAAIGLEEALRADTDLQVFVPLTALSKPAPFARQRCTPTPNGPPYISPSFVMELGADANLLDAIFSLPAATTTQPSRVLVWEQPQQQAWLVVELIRFLPPTTLDYDQHRTNAIRYLQHQNQITLLSQWFDPAQIKTRLNWKDRTGAKDDDQSATAG